MKQGKLHESAKSSATSPNSKPGRHSVSYMHWHGKRRKKQCHMTFRQSELKQYCIFCGDQLEKARVGKMSCGSKQCRRDYEILYKRMAYTSWRHLLSHLNNHTKFK